MEAEKKLWCELWKGPAESFLLFSRGMQDILRGPGSPGSAERPAASDVSSNDSARGYRDHPSTHRYRERRHLSPPSNAALAKSLESLFDLDDPISIGISLDQRKMQRGRDISQDALFNAAAHRGRSERQTESGSRRSRPVRGWHKFHT
ncbi:uncharacterized protein N7515_003881 [Penicillium bovifimosum]|uniref:Uncharacterized protein n=1 Tax=Penicillium bovifimosum TaxID=126998 RepID=A0A9W9L538_9EURO|nr:uncharacterized protein N7515_003881 [Penicillium bovifimosum]KAJ5139033.1 hypothetical protein N7515_003881 [Penicillium bovifimosum]